MTYITKLASIVLMLVVAPLASAQMEDNPIPNSIKGAIIVKHDRSASLPYGIALRETLRTLDAVKDEYGSQIAAEWIVGDMKMDMTEALVFLELILQTFADMEAETQAAIVVLACENHVATANSREAFAVLDQMDDTSAAIAEQYYLEFKASLDGRNSAQFTQWIASQKHKIISVKYDHEKAANDAGRFTTDLLTRICEEQGP